MHPMIHEQMSTQRMEQLRREATLVRRANHANSDVDSKTGSNSFTHVLWYLLFGLHIPSANQKRAAEYSIQGFQAHLNATIWMVGFVALGLGLLIGGFLFSSFGPLPIVLLTSIILVGVSIPILLRSVLVLSKHNQVHSHR
jgi:hypothetical protein